MSSLSTVFITLCMVVVSACVGAMGFLLNLADLSIAITIALACFIAFYALQFHVFMRDTRTAVRSQAEDSQKEMSFLFEQVANLKRYIESLEKEISRSQQQVHALVNRQLDEEANKRSVIEARLVQMEENITQVQTQKIVNFMQGVEQIAEGDTSNILQISEGSLNAHNSVALQNIQAFGSNVQIMSPTQELEKQVFSALKADSVELCLAPIVTLPHRRPRFHHASLQVIIANGQRIGSDEFATLGFSDEILTLADVKIFEKAAIIIPEFRKRTPETAFFINIHRETLRNGRSFTEVLEVLEANPKIVDQIIIGIASNTLSTLDPLESATLGALRKQNLRFCVTDITTLRLDMDSWSAMGMRFAEIPASLLQNDQNAISSDIALADIPLLLRRYGVEIIVTDIHLETTIVEVLEFDVRYGHGFLFGAPRPISISAPKHSSAA